MARENSARRGVNRADQHSLSRRRIVPDSARGRLGSVLALAALVLLALPVAVAALAAGPSVLSAYSAPLPSPADLSNSFAFKTTQILDRSGKLLYEINAQDGGRRLPVDLSQVSQTLVNATIATEDKDFYANPGVDFAGIARAALQDVTTGQIVQGGSTITQQVAKNLFINPSERDERSLDRKIREAVLALRISRAYGKDDVLEMYLNASYYGHLAYGVEAAAQTYFGKHAKDLDLAEASLLAGLPQAPSDYDPLLHLSAAKARQSAVLTRMVEEGYLGQPEADSAARETLSLNRAQPQAFEAPHFVTYVRELLEQRYGASAVYRLGLKVTTTLDLDLNKLAEKTIADHADSLAQQDANNASLVAIDPATGEILAMVGSRDFHDESISGQVNMATSPRQIGSSVKPITYALAFMKGWGPQTIIVDDATTFPGAAGGPPYKPHNFDDKFDGPMTVRYALANSKNIPAIKTLMFDTIPDFVKFASGLGVTFDNPDQYGLTLGLGADGASSLAMAGAYAGLDNNGIYRAPTPILSVEDWDGNVIDRYDPGAGVRAVGAEQAYMITSILSDNWARTPLQGPDSPLKLSRPAAAKTGSTDNYKDAWTIGYTPDLVTSVWVGNTDNHPMKEVVGVLSAGKIWHDFMEDALKDKPAKDFAPPPGIKEYKLCKETGKPATPGCQTVITEVWPISYTPAQYAQIPGLKDSGNASGGALGLTVSLQGGNLAFPPTPTPTPTPDATPTPNVTPTPAGSPGPTPGSPTPTARPQQPGWTPVPARTPIPVPSGNAVAQPTPTPAPVSQPTPAPITAQPGPIMLPTTTPQPTKPPAPTPTPKPAAQAKP